MTISKSAKTSKASKTAKPAEIEFDGSDFPIPKKDAIELDMSVDTALKYVVSMGVVAPEMAAQAEQNKACN